MRVLDVELDPVGQEQILRKKKRLAWGKSELVQYSTAGHHAAPFNTLDTAKGGVPRKRARVSQSGRGAPTTRLGSLAPHWPGYSTLRVRRFDATRAADPRTEAIVQPLWTLANDVREAGAYSRLWSGWGLHACHAVQPVAQHVASASGDGPGLAWPAKSARVWLWPSNRALYCTMPRTVLRRSLLTGG